MTKQPIAPAPDNHFAFIANDVPTGPKDVIHVETITEKLLAKEFWAFGETTPFRAKLRPGNRVFIYLAGNHRRHFVAQAQIAEEARPPQPQEKEILSDLGLKFLRYVVPLRNIERFAEPKPIAPLVQDLEFITEKKNYGLNLRLPIIWLSKRDFERILGAKPSQPKVAKAKNR